MWLFNTKDKTLTEFAIDETPKYAILSHTWGKDEVSFGDVQSGSAASKVGWQKVDSFCEHARNDGFEWVWIDTLCINKESSAELSEAINSMYQWYTRARECYVYLFDAFHAVAAYQDIDPEHDDETQRGFLTAHGGKHVDPRVTHANSIQRHRLRGHDFDPYELHGHDLDRHEDEVYEDLDLGQCRWFTRGWTLQELIASKNISFYGPNWEFLGTKRTLRGTLANVTGISLNVLRNPAEYLSQETIAARMSWAAGRRTTRIEDRAYCLLGILGINLNLLYGEGARAFVRLQEELIRTSTDQSIFAWGLSRDYARPALLAASPDDFEGCQNVIPYNRGGLTSYYITNNGLVINLPLFHRPWDRSIRFGVLNCRIRDDSTGPLTLCLESADDNQTSLGSMETTLYAVTCSKRRGIRSPVKPLEVTEHAVSEMITIQNQTQKRLQYVAPPENHSRAEGKIWLQLAAHYANEYSQNIYAVKKLSNNEENGHQVFRPSGDNKVVLRSEANIIPYTRIYTHEAYAVWRLSQLGSTRDFGVSLRLSGSPSDRTEMRIAIFDPNFKKHLWSDTLGASGEERLAHFALSNAKPVEASVTAQATIPGWADIEVSAVHEHRMGDRLTKVKVSVSAPGSKVRSDVPSKSAIIYTASGRIDEIDPREDLFRQLQQSREGWLRQQHEQNARITSPRSQEQATEPPLQIIRKATEQTSPLGSKRSYDSALGSNVEEMTSSIPSKRGKAMPILESTDHLHSIDIF